MSTVFEDATALRSEAGIFLKSGGEERRGWLVARRIPGLSHNPCRLPLWSSSVQCCENATVFFLDYALRRSMLSRAIN